MAPSLKSANSAFKFSQIKRADWSAGAALFTLANMGALKRKLENGEHETVLKFIEEISSAYLIEQGIDPPRADYTPPVEQEST